LMIRLPARMIDRHLLDAFLGKVDCAELMVVGENLILDIVRDEVEFEDWDDGSGWLAALAPLRAEVLAGDLRLFYLLWLMAVEADAFEPGDPEPMSGIGPMTGTLEAFVNFFGLDPYLVRSAAERSADASAKSSDGARRVITAMTDREKTEILMRLLDGDPHVPAELRAAVRNRLAPGTDASPAAARTVGELRSRAQAIRLARQRTEAERAAADRKRQVEVAEKARRARLDEIKRRGESVWSEIESEIERRNAPGYDKAASLLLDLRAIAEERGAVEDFASRLRTIRERHARKERFIERLAAIG